MHDELTRYTALVARQARAPDAWLALVVLNKRALSSAGSLARSVARRLILLAENASAEDQAHQLLFDFNAGSDDADDGDAEPSVIGAPALADAALERTILMALHEAAVEAARAESKIAALARLLRRVREPTIVFTEYRDTLRHLSERLRPREAALLHGGLSRRERQQAAQAFTSGRVDLLLATDAASEGLNLQARCRLVVNLELPWSPRRLEQRVGRIDRIGQQRTVHAVHLFARGTGESRVLARLVRRTERIRAAFDDPDAIALPGEPALLHAMAGTGPDVVDEAESRADSALVAASVRTVDLGAAARTEAGRLQQVRRICSGAAPAAAISDADCARLRAALDRRAPWITRSPRRRCHALSPPGVLCIYRLVLAPGSAGVAAEETLVPIWLAFDGDHRSVRDEIARVLEAQARQRLAAVLVPHARVVSALREREESLMARAQAEASRAEQLTQQGLFDRRAVRLAERRARARQLDGNRAACRLGAAGEASLRAVIPLDPALVLIHRGAGR